MIIFFSLVYFFPACLSQAVTLPEAQTDSETLRAYAMALFKARGLASAESYFLRAMKADPNDANTVSSFAVALANEVKRFFFLSSSLLCCLC